MSGRRVRSKVDGKLRFKCECGRLLATNEDWSDDDIAEGSRDDLCWGYDANHLVDWPDPSALAGLGGQENQA